MYEFIIVSDLPASPETVWRSVDTMAGVNYELAPIARMTVPETLLNIHFDSAPTTTFRSWILLFGILPIDLHHVRLAELVQHGFREDSSSLLHIYWKHDRTIVALSNGSRLTDHVRFQPRIPFLGYLMKPILAFVFRNRHRNLKRKFGSLIAE